MNANRIKKNMHTYIITIQPGYDLIYNINLILCVNFKHKRQDLQSKVYSERQIILETYHWKFNLLSEFL